MSTNERTKAMADALAAAGFTESRRGDVLARVESIFEFHTALTEAGDSLGSLPDLRGQMEKVAQTAQKLRMLIDGLPVSARHQLGFSPGRYKPSKNPLAVLIERAQSYGESVRRGPGKPKNETLRALLFDLVSLWDDELPNADGITRDGSGPDDGRALYKGPLFDFVLRLLEAEKIPPRSPDAVGHELWQLWSQRRLADERHAAGLCARCEKELHDKARWLCDDCLGWACPKVTVQKPS